MAVGLRDGAVLALIAAGLEAVEISALRASAIRMEKGRVMVHVRRRGGHWWIVFPTDLGARLLAWLTEVRLWGVPVPVFQGCRGPLTPMGICKILRRSATWNRHVTVGRPHEACADVRILNFSVLWSPSDDVAGKWYSASMAVWSEQWNGR
jgi:integrase